jgi:hypothetical protein
LTEELACRVPRRDATAELEMLPRLPQAGRVESSPPEQSADREPPLGSDAGIEGGELRAHAGEARAR